MFIEEILKDAHKQNRSIIHPPSSHQNLSTAHPPMAELIALYHGNTIVHLATRLFQPLSPASLVKGPTAGS